MLFKYFNAYIFSIIFSSYANAMQDDIEMLSIEKKPWKYLKFHGEDSSWYSVLKVLESYFGLYF